MRYNKHSTKTGPQIACALAARSSAQPAQVVAGSHQPRLRVPEGHLGPCEPACVDERLDRSVWGQEMGVKVGVKAADVATGAQMANHPLCEVWRVRVQGKWAAHGQIGAVDNLDAETIVEDELHSWVDAIRHNIELRKSNPNTRLSK